MTNKYLKILLSSLIAIFMANGAKAALMNDGSILLTIDPGVVICPLGGTYPSCSFDITTQSGSYWISSPSGAEEIYQGVGIILGTAQPYSGNPINTQTPMMEAGLILPHPG